MADSPVTLDGAARNVRLGRQLQLLEDPEGTLTFEKVSAPENADRFSNINAEVPNLGLTSSVYWVRFSIKSKEQKDSLWYLEFGDAMFQHIDVYVRESSGTVYHYDGGSMRPSISKEIRAYTHIFPIEMRNDYTTDVFIRLKSSYAFVIPLELWRPSEYATVQSMVSSLHGLYMGIALAMLIYNLALLAAFREVVYLWYSLFVAIVFVNSSCLSGAVPFYLDINPRTLNVVFPISYNVCIVLCWLFSAEFLGRSRFIKIMTLFFLALNIVLSGLYFLGMAAHWTLLTTAAGQISSLILFVIGLVRTINGSRPALFFTLGFGSFLFGSILFASAVFGLIKLNVFTHYATEIGAAVEALMLSLALSHKMQKIRDEKHAAQSEANESRRIALDTVTSYSKKLEVEVHARTAELITTQQKLVASEKMAALGVFTAGMAHEINNPANFVAAGAQNAEAQLGKFKGFVGELLDDEAPDEIKGEFGQHFTKLGDSLSVIRTGITRIENVVKHLRATHPEGDVGMQPADVVESLESAWRVLSPTVKTSIVLSTQLDARPQVSCMIAEINQVFLALLSNAAHAVEDAVSANGPDYKGEIRLASHESDGKLVIAVSDNGIGIPADKIDKVFDPFFTTKTVGRGAGLGLSMARDVVKKHGGTLEVESVEGQGARFTLALPLGASVD